MSMTLYKNGMKGSWKLLVALAALLTMYFALIIAMFDPSLGAVLDELAKAMPQIMAMFGMAQAGTTLIGFMSSYLYGLVMLFVPMIYTIVIANQLVAKQIDHGSMAYLLAAPVSRFKIALTQLKVLSTGIVSIVAFATLVGLVSAGAMFPAALDVGKFLLLNLGALCLHLFIGGICFLASCIFNETKYSLAIGAGITTVSLIIQMLANAGDGLKNAKYITFFTLFNPDGIINGDSVAFWGIAILAIGAFILCSLAILIFTKKDIPV